MSATINTGGPAFPVGAIEDEHSPGCFHGGYEGMSLRDYFATKAMQGFVSGHIAHYGHDNHWPFSSVASGAYSMADAMLKAREGGAA